MIYGRSEVDARMATYRYWTRPAEETRQRAVAEGAPDSPARGDRSAHRPLEHLLVSPSARRWWVRLAGHLSRRSGATPGARRE